MPRISEKPAEETKAQAFKRVAGIRVANALEAIRKCEALGNDANYEFTEAQATKIVEALRDAISSVENHLAGQVVKSKRRFQV